MVMHMKMITCSADRAAVFMPAAMRRIAPFLCAHHLLYHLAHLVKLAASAAFTSCTVAPAARSDALAAAGVEDIGMAAFLRGHGLRTIASGFLKAFSSISTSLNLLPTPGSMLQHVWTADPSSSSGCICSRKSSRFRSAALRCSLLPSLSVLSSIACSRWLFRSGSAHRPCLGCG